MRDLSGKPELARRYGGTKLLVAAPMQYSDLMAKVPEGKIVTADQIHAYLAKEAGAEVTCHMTAGLFINISAHASEERDADHIPWWRTLKAGGELNEKYPGGIERQKQMLEMEGQTVECKGKRCFVKGYEEKCYTFS